MSQKHLWAVPLLVLGLASCNDKAPEIQQAPAPATQNATEVPAEPASAPSVPTLLAEFQGNLRTLGKVELCALDAVNGQGAAEGVFKIAANSPVALEGWVATTSLTNPTAVTVVLSGASKSFGISGPAGIARDDVAKAYKAEALTHPGFKLELPALDVPAGDYSITLLHDEAGTPVACGSPLKLVVN